MRNVSTLTVWLVEEETWKMKQKLVTPDEKHENDEIVRNEFTHMNKETEELFPVLFDLKSLKKNKTP